MQDKPEAILRLERRIGREIEKMPIEKIMPYGFNGYSLDENRQIVGLNLYNANISDISFLEDRNFKYITHLELSNNNLIDISLLSDFVELKELKFYNNQLREISSLSGLLGLRSLSLGENQLREITSLSGLVGLRFLNLSGNQLREITSLSGLVGLEELYLGNNQLREITSLSGLVSLRNLSLSYNYLSEISPLVGLKNLQTLFLENNHITTLPPEILKMGLDIKWEYEGENNGIFLSGNPLESPPVEIVKQGNDAIRNYFEELKSASVRLLETKLLIVGNGEVGKTTLMRKLMDPLFKVVKGEETTTKGINIEPWELDCPFPDCGNEKVNVHFWDFGGQAIYHATHQFFLTKRSLYLFVWEARKEEEHQTFDYWLNVIKLLSEESPVIIVMNKSDVRIKHLDEANFKEKFPNIVDFLQVSCIDDSGLLKLTEQIRTTLGTMPHLQDKLPKVWKQIRDRLNEDHRDYITQDEYLKICSELGLDLERGLYLSSYLHDLGVILHYPEGLLEYTVILNPEWVTEAVYKLIDTREVQIDKGRFLFDKLREYWDLKRFPVDKHMELMLLMEKFELCFNVVGTHTYIIPELLPPKRPEMDFDKYKGIQNLRVQYNYDFMPEGIISRFISRVYYLIAEDHFWKNGVELTFESATALVISEPLDRKLSISVSGKGKVELLAIIRNELTHIHRTLKMEKGDHYQEMIACICSKCRNSPKPFIFAQGILKRRFEKGRSVDYCGISDEEVSIEKLLKGVERTSPKEIDLLDMFLDASRYLQGIRKSIKDLEDNRNDFVKVFLESKGLYVQDQNRWGVAASGKTIGRLDFKITNPDTGEEFIAEAFRLDSLKKDTIDLHLEKLFFYDANGLPRNFILVYAENKNFNTLWKKYLDYIPTVSFTYPVIDIQEQEGKYNKIKIARVRHNCNDSQTEVYHIFIDMSR